MPQKTLTAGQRAYEAKRAAKAGMPLEKWLASKDKQIEAEARAKARAAEPPKPAKPPGVLRRLLDRAHQPLKPDAKALKAESKVQARSSRTGGSGKK